MDWSKYAPLGGPNVIWTVSVGAGGLWDACQTPLQPGPDNVAGKLTAPSATDVSDTARTADSLNGMESLQVVSDWPTAHVEIDPEYDIVTSYVQMTGCRDVGVPAFGCVESEQPTHVTQTTALSTTAIDRTIIYSCWSRSSGSDAWTCWSSRAVRGVSDGNLKDGAGGAP